MRLDKFTVKAQEAVQAAQSISDQSDQEQIARIVDIQLESLRQRLAAKRMELEVTDVAKAVLAREGYDPTFGARPLKRTIQRLVQDPLALKLLEGEFKEGDTITVDAHGHELVFSG